MWIIFALFLWLLPIIKSGFGIVTQLIFILVIAVNFLDMLQI